MERPGFIKHGVLRLPPGFRFHPTDEELVVQYLKRKVLCCPLPAAVIPEINLSKYDPWDLPGTCEFRVQRKLLHLGTKHTDLVCCMYAHPVELYQVKATENGISSVFERLRTQKAAAATEQPSPATGRPQGRIGRS